MTIERDRPIYVRDVLRLLREADRYPRIGNDDWRTADRMEAEALAKAPGAMALPGDPPAFAAWLTALQKPGISSDEREAIYTAINSYFTKYLARGGALDELTALDQELGL